MRRFRGYNEVDDHAGQELLDQVLEQRRRLGERLAGVRFVVAVVSGKGGVGKSAITANLACSLAAGGARVGVVDADLNGPSLGRMLGGQAASLRESDVGLEPIVGAGGVRFVSMDLFLERAASPVRWAGPTGDSFVWRGTLETGTLREFLSDLDWGELDYLLVDVPPGTDRIERLLDLIPSPAAVVLVTLPTAASLHVVAKSATLLSEAGVSRVGLVVNMSSYRCACCGCDAPLFPGGDTAPLREQPGIRLWGEIPFDPILAEVTDGGNPAVLSAPESPGAVAMIALARRLREELEA
jgi:ATP-binding protein involved in chromosome partitioning